MGNKQGWALPLPKLIALKVSRLCNRERQHKQSSVFSPSWGHRSREGSPCGWSLQDWVLERQKLHRDWTQGSAEDSCKYLHEYCLVHMWEKNYPIMGKNHLKRLKACLVLTASWELCLFLPVRQKTSRFQGIGQSTQKCSASMVGEKISCTVSQLWSHPTNHKSKMKRLKLFPSNVSSSQNKAQECV